LKHLLFYDQNSKFFEPPQRDAMNYRNDLNALKIFSAYSDESGCFSGQYQSIGIISGERRNLFELKHELVRILQHQKVKEAKFSETRTHKPKLKAAQAFIKKGVDFAKQNKIRIDVLLWDTHDSRHSIPGRDDLANLERMYYKVLRHISEKWNQYNWDLYPDKGSKINWIEIKDYLNRTRIPRHRKPYLLILFDEEAYSINFQRIDPKESHDEPLIQIADLFAGIACFCREKGKECLKWLKSQEKRNQLDLFEYEEPEVEEDPNKTEKNRYELIRFLNNQCKFNKLGVSLNKRKYLWTPVPYNPINFWNYKPKHKEDKAPTG